MTDVLYDHIQAHEQQWWDEYVALCRQPSIAAQGLGMAEAVEMCASMLRRRGFQVEICPTPGYPGIYAVLPGAGSRTLLFYNHYDVQPPDPVEAWRHPPFAGVVEDGVFYCRGASDHKGSLVSRIQAVEALQATEGRLPCTIKFLIEGEEELGSPHLGYLVEQHRQKLRCDAALYGGCFKTEDGRPTISAGGKGVLYLTLRARGPEKDIHSRMATLVANPAWRLHEALATMREASGRITIDGFEENVIPPGPEELAAAGRIPPGFPFAPGRNFKADIGITEFLEGISDADAAARHLFAPTLNICGFQSGYTGQGYKNVIPATAEVKLDMLLIPNQTADEMTGKIARHLQRRGFTDIEVEFGAGLDPARTPLTEHIVAAATAAARTVYGVDPVVSPLFPGFGPWCVLIRDLGVPTIADTGVSHARSGHHEPNENIHVADYLPGVRNIAELIRQFARDDR